jgi:hypothetical protein
MSATLVSFGLTPEQVAQMTAQYRPVKQRRSPVFRSKARIVPRKRTRLKYVDMTVPKKLPPFELTEAAVLVIRKQADQKKPLARIALELDLSVLFVEKVVTGELYPQFGGPLSHQNPWKKQRRFKPHEIVQIREEVAAGGVHEEVGKKWGVSGPVITGIVFGYTYKEIGGPVKSKKP